VLGSKEEVVVLVEESAMEGDQSLPLVVVKLVCRIALGALVVVDFDAFALHHDETGVDTLDLGHQLLLGDGTGLGLLDKLGWVLGRRGWFGGPSLWRVRLAMWLGERGRWRPLALVGYLGLVEDAGRTGSSGSAIVRGPKPALLESTPVELGPALLPRRGGCGPSLGPLGR
jgi:hypothetical protein